MPHTSTVPASTASDPESELGGVPLARKLPLLIVSVLTVVLAVSLFASYFEVKHSAESSAAERLTGLSRVLGSLIEQQVSARVAIMRRVAHDTAVANSLLHPDNKPSPSTVHALAALSITPADTATPAELWTADGRAVGAMSLQTPADAERLGNELRRESQLPDSAFFGPLHHSGGRTSYLEAVPVRDVERKVIGYVVQERRFGTNPRALQPFRDIVGSGINVYLRNANNDFWVGLNGDVVNSPTSIDRPSDTLSTLTRGKGGRFLESTRVVRGSPFLVTVELPEQVILARPLATIRALILIALVLALIGAAAAWAMSRRLVRPLSELTGAAEWLAQGRYDRRVRVRTTDEIGRLGGAFNRMADEVQASSETSSRALDRLTDSMETQAFLAEASRILAGSVSDETLVPDLARFCVPHLADYCSVHVANEDGSLRRIETAHRDSAMEPLVRRLVGRYQYRVDGPGEVPDVIRSQQPLVLPNIEIARLIATSTDPETKRLLEQVYPTSFLCVPLVARGRAIGAMSFTMTTSGRVFGPRDVDMAGELARRAAVAIDNSLIYRRSVVLRLEAEAASNAKSDFLAKMSHEIRTPINAMMGYAELLQMGISGPVTETQFKQLERIRSSGDHLTALVNEILDLAKIEAGRMGVQPTVAKTGDAVESALSVVRPSANAKNVELASHATGDSEMEYFGDPQRVHQILTNLLSNAVKFTQPGGAIAIHCGLDCRPGTTFGDWASIVVTDTGVGIGPDDLERIFQPFVQVDSGYTRAQGGTGLGLTISRNLAQMMGGDITAESELGRGSQFTIWLPRPVRA
jgi:signal transduction histidine kinase